MDSLEKLVFDLFGYNMLVLDVEDEFEIIFGRKGIIGIDTLSFVPQLSVEPLLKNQIKILSELKFNLNIFDRIYIEGNESYPYDVYKIKDLLDDYFNENEWKSLNDEEKWDKFYHLTQDEDDMDEDEMRDRALEAFAIVLWERGAALSKYKFLAIERDY